MAKHPRVCAKVVIFAKCCRSSVVEHSLGKGEVESPILSGSTISRRFQHVHSASGTDTVNPMQAALAAALCLSVPAQAESPGVDLALIFAVDCSGSVDGRELRLQLGGIAAGFRDKAVQAAIAAGPRHRIAVNLMLWADPDEQKLTTGWQVVGSAQEAEAFAAVVEDNVIAIGGGTGLATAMAYGINLVQNSGYDATRRTIDVSGDGRDSWELREPRFRMAHARALRDASDVTVNGLAISNEQADLLDYYRNEVIGGPGSFVLEAKSYEEFAKAMRIKLLREILPDMAAAE